MPPGCNTDITIKLSITCHANVPVSGQGAFECLSNVPGWRQRYSNVSRMPRGQWGGIRISFECPRVWGGALEYHSNAPRLRGGHSNIIQISFKYNLNIIQISFKYHSNIIQISFEYPGVRGGDSNIIRISQGQGGGIRISFEYPWVTRSNVIRMPQGRDGESAARGSGRVGVL